MSWSQEGHFRMVRILTVGLLLVFFIARGECAPVQAANWTWNSWGNWHGCNATCNNGTGVETRTRECLGLSLQTSVNNTYNSSNCAGDRTQTQSCINDTPCAPVDGGWSEWMEWRNCSATWNNETITRYRTCTNPAPQHGGDACNGTSKESMVCDTNITCLAVNGSWNECGEWQNCSALCDDGTITQYWTCTNPSEQQGGEPCNMTGEEFNVTLPVDGGWSNWTSWSACSETCGQGGQTTRSRSCNNPIPTDGGLSCTGDSQQVGQCNAQPACLVTHWSEWGTWTPCNAVPCTEGQRGLQARHRTCEGGTQAQCYQLPGLFAETQRCDSDLTGCS